MTSGGRRAFVAGGLLAALGAAGRSGRAASAIPAADAHSHYGLFRSSKIADGAQLGSELRDAGVTLLAWSITSDGPWIRMGRRRFEQVGEPEPGALQSHFFRSLARAKRMAERAGLPIAMRAEDVDRAAAGEPHLVLAAECADFAEGSIAVLERAAAAGLRHTQLVHYLRSPAGDIQTEEPRHGGLTPYGVELVRACNRLGVLVDLAHSPRNDVDMALDAAAVAPVWSHSVVSETDEDWRQPGGLARRLHVSRARRIAARGGAVGLWGLGASTGYRVAGYVDSLLRTADLVGVAHVMIGSDMDGFSQNERASLTVPADLRRVVDELLDRRVSEADVRAICFGNYARCLRGAMAAQGR